jgi:hypothetical protein
MSDVYKTTRLRGAILGLLYTRHNEQKSHLDSVALWSTLNGLRFDVGQNEVVTILQDLKGRGYVNFEQEKNKYTNRVYCTLIELTPRGRDVVDELIVDPAVTV